MPIELEAKIKVDDLAPIRQRLEAAGAKLIGDALELNAIFDTEDRSLLAADKGLRVRCARDVTTGTENCTLTFKGPRRPSALKSREEIELHVDSYDHAMALLQQLKFVHVLLFEKRRQSWELAGCKVELDQLPPDMGTYVEIEGATDQSILHVQQLLGLAGRHTVKTSYVGLVMSHLQDRGSTNRVLLFPQNPS